MPSFGENLKRERELRGIGLPEIAQATKISVRFLQALESDRVEILPGGIFRRSFVKAYAVYVGLDPERTVSEFLDAHADEGASGERSGAAARVPSRGLYRRLFFGLVVLAVGSGLFWLMRPSHPSPPAAPPPASAAAPSLVFPQDRLLPSVSSAEALVGAHTTGPLVLTLAAHESCWVGVQADGRVVLSRVLESGETQTLRANDELVLSVGNAGALAVRINDRPGLSLGRRGEVRRNIVITRENLPSLVEDATPEHSSHSG
jgi:cytoskeleton protein RodZ